MLHRHHIIPKHDGGTDEEQNLTPPIPIRLHAAFHYDRWKVLGRPCDYIAWRTLMGMISVPHAKWMARNSGVLSSMRKRLELDPSASWLNTPEAIAKRSAAMRGIPRSEACRSKMSKTLKGHSVSLETRAKLRTIHTGRRRTAEAVMKQLQSVSILRSKVCDICEMPYLATAHRRHCDECKSLRMAASGVR
jgi:hypothetical protein